ncbi:MAG: hypothetical protein JO112_00055 [Planctomycetes bacterium]|nr:hypothetical protein [Planctomycetota bacterium]
MTEQEWLTQTENPLEMIWFLGDRASARKLRLYACGCFRRIWHLASPETRKIIEVAERLADGLARPREVGAARRAPHQKSEDDRNPTWEAAENALDRNAQEAARITPAEVAMLVGALALPPGSTAYFPFSVPLECDAAMASEVKLQVDLLRDNFGNPFRPEPVLDSAWLSWNRGAIGKLAQSIYDERSFSDLPILADALEEAGCTDPSILEHCRGPGPHCRGCWVVDQILGKK